MQSLKVNSGEILVETGDVVLFRTPLKWFSPMSWLSALIRLFTGAPYNHVGVIVENWGVAFVNEANERGLVTSPAKARLYGRDILILKPKFRPNPREFSRIANSVLGVSKYDFKSLFVYQLLFQLFGTWKGKTDASAKDRFYCSEFAAWMHRETAESMREWYLIDPRALYDSPDFTGFKP